MKSVIICLGLFALCSCSTSSISTQSVNQVNGPLKRVVIFYVHQPVNIQHFDSLLYTKAIKGYFNDLQSIEFRSKIEKTLKENTRFRSTQFISSSDLFKVNNDISYYSFSTSLENIKADALLIINEDESWVTTQQVQNGPTVTEEYQPNAAFHIHLINAKTKEIVWAGRCTVRGVMASYNNLLSKAVHKTLNRLEKDGFIQ